MEESPAVTEGMDRAWLRRAVEQDPVAHSFAAWDVDHEPDRVRFLSYRHGATTVAYLLFWLGEPSCPFVHWVGPPRSSLPLADHLPPRPFVVAGEAGLVEAVTEKRGPFVVTSLLRLVARPSGPVPMSEDPRKRRVTGPDVERLRSWARGHQEPMVRGYARFDPERHVVWGAFHGDRVVGAAFASVRLPQIWTFNAIYVEPFARGERLGMALTAHAVEAARRARATAHLNVRESNLTARHVYERLGFELHDRVVLLEPRE